MARQSLNPMKDLESTEVEVDGATGPLETMTHLKFLRKKNGYTLETLSKVTNISISYLSRLESGSRRLNTDLIRRLSHAFGCDPSELLQEVSHNKRVVTPVDFTARTRNFNLLRQNTFDRHRQQTGPMKDIPVYCLSKESTENGDRVVLLRTAPVDWRYRPVELAGKDVFAIKSGTHFKPYFTSTAILYLTGNRNLSPESTVIIAPNSGDIMLKKVWSVTPNSIQVCNFDEIEGLKKGAISPDRLVTLENDNIQELYKVIGFADFDVM